MSYQSVVEMASSQSLLARVIACVAGEGEEDPKTWASTHIWEVVSSPDWDEAWEYAKATYSPDHNPDTGARPGVINDNMILAAVQAARSD